MEAFSVLTAIGSTVVRGLLANPFCPNDQLKAKISNPPALYYRRQLAIEKKIKRKKRKIHSKVPQMYPHQLYQWLALPHVFYLEQYEQEEANIFNRKTTVRKKKQTNWKKKKRRPILLLSVPLATARCTQCEHREKWLFDRSQV